MGINERDLQVYEVIDGVDGILENCTITIAIHI